MLAKLCLDVPGTGANVPQLTNVTHAYASRALPQRTQQDRWLSVCGAGADQQRS